MECAVRRAAESCQKLSPTCLRRCADLARSITVCGAFRNSTTRRSATDSAIRWRAWRPHQLRSRSWWLWPPRLIGDLGFDRAIISQIDDGIWISQGSFVVDDPQWAELITRVGQEHPQPLVPGLFETEIVRRRRPLVVTDVQHDPRVHRPLAEATLSRSYVAALIISRARVVGLLHADRYLQDRETDLVDREVLYSFAQGLRLALSRAAIAEQLQSAGHAYLRPRRLTSTGRSAAFTRCRWTCRRAARPTARHGSRRRRRVRFVTC